MRAAAKVVEQLTGIISPKYRWPILQAELERLGAADGLRAGLERLREGDREATKRLLRVASIPETYLFRHSGHFNILHQIALDLQQQGQPCRVLCAGCSSGEEVWSAAAVLATIPTTNGKNHSVTGWELCASRLRQATAARYGAWSCRGGFLQYSRFFPQDGTCFTVDTQLRELVSFQQVNLVAYEPPVFEPYDVIFFRNVALYWRQETVDRVWRLLTRLVSRDGTIFVGPSDPIPADAGGWQQQISNNVRSYRPGRSCVSPPMEEQQAASPARAPIVPAPQTVPMGRQAGPSAPGRSSPVHNLLQTSRRQSDAIAAESTTTGSSSRSTEALADKEQTGTVLDTVRSLADSGRYREALDLLDRENAGSSVDGKLWHGILTLNLGNTAQALSMFRQCVYLRPGDPALRHWLAVAYGAVGRRQDAEREHRNALQLEEARQ
jgi:chemotaxis methyl-accepting protein methylase